MNYLERMTKEYEDLRNKIDKLDTFIVNYDKNENTLDCPFELLIRQLNAMQTYANVLILRIKYCEGSI